MPTSPFKESEIEIALLMPEDKVNTIKNMLTYLLLIIIAN